MKIKALVPFSNGTLSMEQYQVAEVTDTLGNQLIAAGVAIEIGGGTGGGVLAVTDTDGTLDKTWQEIHDAFVSVGAVVCNELPFPYAFVVSGCIENSNGNEYTVFVGYEGNAYVASSASGYPVAL